MDMLGQLLGKERSEHSEKVYGVAPAIVISVKDTKHQRHAIGMVQVFFPWLQDRDDPNLIAPWARLVRPEAGTAGMVVYPQIDDEVLCAFEHGDIHHPYILGGLWNGKHKVPGPKPPEDK